MQYIKVATNIIPFVINLFLAAVTVGGDSEILDPECCNFLAGAEK